MYSLFFLYQDTKRGILMMKLLLLAVIIFAKILISKGVALGKNGKSYIKTKYYEIKESIMSDSVNNDVAP